MPASCRNNSYTCLREHRRRGKGCPGLWRLQTPCLRLPKGSQGRRSPAGIPENAPLTWGPGCSWVQRPSPLRVYILDILTLGVLPENLWETSEGLILENPEPDIVNALKYAGLVKTVGLETFWFAIKTRFCWWKYQVTPTSEWQMHIYKNKETKKHRSHQTGVLWSNLASSQVLTFPWIKLLTHKLLWINLIILPVLVVMCICRLCMIFYLSKLLKLVVGIFLLSKVSVRSRWGTRSEILFFCEASMLSSQDPTAVLSVTFPCPSFSLHGFW